MYPSDTIVATSTAQGKAGIGVLRLSGPIAAQIGMCLSRRKQLKTRVATSSSFYDQKGAKIDNGILIFFKHPSSYTGEDVVEIQGHGGVVVQKLLLSRCAELGARLAEPGEFTKRAFLNGKIDLLQAENVQQLISASTERAARSAMRSLEGEGSNQLRVISDRLTSLRAEVEARIDFSDEEVDPIDEESFLSRLEGVAKDLNIIHKNMEQGVILQKGVKVVLFGPPNVGKSTIFNKLLQKESALVTDIAGTTRDALTGQFELGGVRFEIVDTAGLRDSHAVIEKLGIDKTKQELSSANIALYISDNQKHLSNYQRLGVELPDDAKLIKVLNKTDLSGIDSCFSSRNGESVVSMSALYDENLAPLKKAIFATIGEKAADEEGVLMANGRQIQAVKDCLLALKKAQLELERLELLAEELRAASNSLGIVTGEVAADDILGVIFAEFCIGK